ncbi:MAG: RIP metalloprotease RseP [Armatimonadota bacterium]|nr:RIP metalloprotease RseP [bacterium]
MIIETAIALIFIFAILIMFHELGHYSAARLVGMRVEEFAFGFGPKLLTLFKRGDTEYTIHPYPLGGFVKIAGMEPGEEDIPDGFQAQAIWKRALVIFAGPFASFVLAVIVFIVMGLFWGFPTGTTENRIAMVSPKTEAHRIGLRAGDRIVSINGVKIASGKDMTGLIHDNPGEQLTLTVKRNDHTLTKKASPSWNIYYLGAAWSFAQGKNGTVEYVAEKSAAAKAGIKKNDKIVGVNGKNTKSGSDFVSAIETSGDKPVSIIFKRGRKTINITARPNTEWVEFGGAHWVFPGGIADKVSKGSQFKYADMLTSIAGKKIKTGDDMLKVLRKNKSMRMSAQIERDGEKKRIVLHPYLVEYQAVKHGVYTAIGLLGFMPEQTLVKTGFVDSIKKGLLITKGMAEQLIDTLTSSRIKEEVGGPLMIAKVTASSVARGIYPVMSLLGGLSLSLAFINLIPIPVVDGGHLVILAVEAIRCKRLTREQMQVITLIGMAILGVIFVTVIWSDLFKISQGLVPQ